MISRAFSSMPGLASGIARDIREGTVKKYLIQPIDMLGFLLLYRVAHKLVYYVRGGGAVCAGVLSLPRLLSRLARRRTLAGLPGLAGDGVPAGILLEATLGMIGFWFLEVSSLLFVYMLLQLLLFRATCFRWTCCPACWGVVGASGCRCNTWPIFPPPCSWARSSGGKLVRGLCDRGWLGCWFSVATGRLAFPLRRAPLQRLSEDEGG